MRTASFRFNKPRKTKEIRVTPSSPATSSTPSSPVIRLDEKIDEKFSYLPDPVKELEELRDSEHDKLYNTQYDALAKAAGYEVNAEGWEKLTEEQMLELDLIMAAQMESPAEYLPKESTQSLNIGELVSVLNMMEEDAVQEQERFTEQTDYIDHVIASTKKGIVESIINLGSSLLHEHDALKGGEEELNIHEEVLKQLNHILHKNAATVMQFVAPRVESNIRLLADNIELKYKQASGQRESLSGTFLGAAKQKKLLIQVIKEMLYHKDTNKQIMDRLDSIKKEQEKNKHEIAALMEQVANRTRMLREITMSYHKELAETRMKTSYGKVNHGEQTDESFVLFSKSIQQQFQEMLDREHKKYEQIIIKLQNEWALEKRELVNQKRKAVIELKRQYLFATASAADPSKAAGDDEKSMKDYLQQIIENEAEAKKDREKLTKPNDISLGPAPVFQPQIPSTEELYRVRRTKRRLAHMSTQTDVEGILEADLEELQLKEKEHEILLKSIILPKDKQQRYKQKIRTLKEQLKALESDLEQKIMLIHDKERRQSETEKKIADMQYDHDALRETSKVSAIIINRLKKENTTISKSLQKKTQQLNELTEKHRLLNEEYKVAVRSRPTYSSEAASVVASAGSNPYRHEDMLRLKADNERLMEENIALKRELEILLNALSTNLSNKEAESVLVQASAAAQETSVISPKPEQSVQPVQSVGSPTSKIKEITPSAVDNSLNSTIIEAQSPVHEDTSPVQSFPAPRVTSNVRYGGGFGSRSSTAKESVRGWSREDNAQASKAKGKPPTPKAKKKIQSFEKPPTPGTILVEKYSQDLDGGPNPTAYVSEDPKPGIEIKVDHDSEAEVSQQSDGEGTRDRIINRRSKTSLETITPSTTFSIEIPTRSESAAKILSAERPAEDDIKSSKHQEDLIKSGGIQWPFKDDSDDDKRRGSPRTELLRKLTKKSKSPDSGISLSTSQNDFISKIYEEQMMKGIKPRPQRPKKKPVSTSTSPGSKKKVEPVVITDEDLRKLTRVMPLIGLTKMEQIKVRTVHSSVGMHGSPPEHT